MGIRGLLRPPMLRIARYFGAAVMVWFGMLALPVCTHAQLSAERLFPPAVAAGQTATVIADGKFPNWPADVVCDRDDVRVLPAETSGQLTVEVPADAGPGVAWIRFTDAKSASPLLPLLISSVPVTVESEPNDLAADAVAIELPSKIVGRLAKSGDSDAYRIHVRQGQTLVASVQAHSLLASPMDAVMQLTDVDGNVLIQSDDARGLDPQIVYPVPVEMDCLLRVFAFPETPNSTIGFAGAASFVYAIDVTTGAFVDHAAPTDASATVFGFNLERDHQVVVQEATSVSPAIASVPGAIGWGWIRRPQGVIAYRNSEDYDGVIPALISGHIAENGATDVYKFDVQQGAKYRAEVHSKVYGFPFDSNLVIVDSKTGETLASNDDLSRGGYDAGLEFTPKMDGPVEVRVSDLVGGFGPRHYYELSLSQELPTAELKVSDEHFIVTKGKPLEVTVSLSRSGGFSKDLSVAAVDLPDGVVCQPVISEAKGDTSKSVKLKLSADDQASGHASFRILATEIGDGGQSEGEPISATYDLRPSVSISRFWLTVSDDGKE